MRPARTRLLALSALAALSALSALGGCTVGPDYVRPAMPVAATFKELEGTGWTIAQPADNASRGAWWTIYEDATLDALEAQVESANQNVQAAQAHFRGARANVAQQRSSFFPLVTASGDYSRYRTSQNVLYTSKAGQTINDYSVGIDATWEPDIWGRVARNVEAARANAQASAADRQAVLLSMQAELATDYFELRGIDRERQLLDDTIKAYRESLELTQNRYAGGIATDADVGQAQTQLQTTEAQAIDLGVQRAQLEHAIAILIGQSPSTFTLPVAPKADYTVRAIASPPGVPSTLLERRPDIAAAERRIAAANAQVGVATANMYPQITLSASYGPQALTPAGLLKYADMIWSIGAGITQPIFHGGQLSAQKRAAEAAFDQANAQYRQTVLLAFQNVADTLRALEHDATGLAAQTDAWRAASASLDLTRGQFRVGGVSYLALLDAQRQYQQTVVNLAQAQAARYADTAALFQALGGGWWNDTTTSQAAPVATPQ